MKLGCCWESFGSDPGDSGRNKTMASKIREWPDTYSELRNNVAKIVNYDIDLLMSVHINKLSDAEEKALETVIKHSMKIREGFLAAGAQEQPLIELNKIAHSISTAISVQ